MDIHVKMMDQSALMTIVGGLTERRGTRSRQKDFSTRYDARSNDSQETSEPAAGIPAKKLPPGPWRSLGGYMDYSGWDERERFLELDAAIARIREQDREREHTEREVMTAASATSEWIDWRASLRAGQDAA